MDHIRCGDDTERHRFASVWNTHEYVMAGRSGISVSYSWQGTKRPEGTGEHLFLRLTRRDDIRDMPWFSGSRDTNVHRELILDRSIS